MRKMILTYSICLLLVSLFPAMDCYSQKYPERKHIRSGNRHYEKGEFEEGETEYLRALEKEPDSYQARFNLGNVLYKQMRYEQAAEIFQGLSRESSSGVNTANSHYNAGNALFQQRKLEEALEEYKQALRLNPDDMEAKFNYAYTKKLLEKNDEDNQQKDDQQDDEDEGEGGGGGGNDGQNQDGDGDDGGQDGGNDGEDDRNDDGQDERSDPDENNGNDSPGDKDRSNDDKPGGGNRNTPSGMSREEAEQLLQAMQMNEDKTREKVEEENARAVTAGSRNNW